MAEPASAIIQLIHFTYKTARFIQEYARAIKGHNSRVHELGETIQRHGETLWTVHAVYEKLKDLPDEDIRTVAKNLKRRVRKSRDALEKLTQIKGEWGCGELPALTRALRYWSYDQDGGRRELEGVLSMIADLEASIRTELIAANIFLNTANSPATDRVSVFSWADTLAETETDNEDERGVLSKALIMAIGTRIPKEVKLRLKDGDSVLACDPNECNALHYAVKAGGKRVLTELLKCKEIRRNPGGVNIPDREGETPLHLAVRLGKTELVLELLNARADVNALDRYGRPPLERALGGNRDDIVEVLLKHKADESLLIHERKMDATIARRLSQVKQIIKSRS